MSHLSCTAGSCLASWEGKVRKNTSFKTKCHPQQQSIPVLLKLDSIQPSGSFKIRGIGRTCQAALAEGSGSGRRLVGSSGGNAGLAMAHAADTLGARLTLFVPQATPKMIQEKLKVKFGHSFIIYDHKKSNTLIPVVPHR